MEISKHDEEIDANLRQWQTKPILQAIYHHFHKYIAAELTRQQQPYRRTTAGCYLAGLILCMIVAGLYLTSAETPDRAWAPFLLVLTAALLLQAQHWPYQVGTTILVSALFAVPLLWQWSIPRYDGFVIAGVLPWSDASGYYLGALRLLHGVPLDALSSRRPFFPGFLGVLLSLTGTNLQQTLTLFCILNAVACTLLAHEIRRTFGVVSAAIVLVATFYCYNGYPFVGAVVTEHLGLAMGALGLSAVIRGAATGRAGWLLCGSFLFSMALNARAGALLVLPALVGWALVKDGFRLARNNVMFALKVGLAAALGFACNIALLKTAGCQQSKLFSNFGSVLYGMASGYQDWTLVYHEHPGINEREIMPLAVEKIRKDPKTWIIGVIRAYKDYFKPSTMFRFLYLPDRAQQMISYLLFVLGLLSLFRMIATIRNPLSSVLILLNAGILASIPFVPPIDDGIRAMTATIPITGLTAAYLFGRKRDRNDTPPTHNLADYSGPLGVALTVLCVLGPIVVKYTAKPLVVPSGEYPGGYECIPLEVHKGGYVNIVADDSVSRTRVPIIRRSDYLAAMKGREAQYPELWAALNDIEAGQSLITGLNLDDLRKKYVRCNVWLITQTSAITNWNGMNQFVARPTTNTWLAKYRFYHDRSVDAKIAK